MLSLWKKPPSLIHRVPTDIEDDAILLALQQQEVIKSSRWLKTQPDGSKVKTQTACITFIGERRASVKLDYINYKCHEVIPRPLICYKCWQFDHIAKACKNIARFRTCSGPHEANSSCTAAPACPTCNSGGHTAGSMGCPMFASRQKAISHTVDLNQLIASPSSLTTQKENVWLHSTSTETAADARLNKIEEQLATLAQSLPTESSNSLQHRFSGLNEKVNQIEREMKEVQTKLQTLEDIKEEVSTLNPSS